MFRRPLPSRWWDVEVIVILGVLPVRHCHFSGNRLAPYALIALRWLRILVAVCSQKVLSQHRYEYSVVENSTFPAAPPSTESWSTQQTEPIFLTTEVDEIDQQSTMCSAFSTISWLRFNVHAARGTSTGIQGTGVDYLPEMRISHPPCRTLLFRFRSHLTREMARMVPYVCSRAKDPSGLHPRLTYYSTKIRALGMTNHSSQGPSKTLVYHQKSPDFHQKNPLWCSWISVRLFPGHYK